MPNKLISEQSPYLLQHAHNPVDWYPWSDEPFERAKKENKPLLVSIGYAACHWCHVMERESFEHEDVAAYMNEHFINIKVDREEHPDVDHLYMDAIQAISGSGGWPLNVFVTPDRIPFYGGTYFPPTQAFNRPSWMQLLQRLHSIWTEQPDEIKQQADQMLQYLKNASQISFAAAGSETDKQGCVLMAQNLLKLADKQYGGFSRAPKFPGTMAISFLLDHYHFTKNKAALEHALFSLDKMIEGGIYDQVGGGFARYATDEKWLVPHFEKMLYDNALIILSLCDAYQQTKKDRYKEVIEETISFCDRELKDVSGVYYSALDADSEGEEGKFYTWTREEWKEAIGDDEISEAYFGITEEGNWEHTNILHVSKLIEEIAKEKDADAEQLKKHIASVKQKLFEARKKRVRPLTDDKTLLSWNALMNLALSRAGIVLQNENYVHKAEEHMQQLISFFETGNGLMHVYKNGKARIPAKLDDYAYLIQALLQLASAGDREQWILKANSLCDETIRLFSEEEQHLFYFTSSEQKDIPVRKADVYDGATPSANAVMANNLLLLGMCMERNDLASRGNLMLQQMSATARRYTYSFGYWAMMIQRELAGMKTIVFAGADAEQNKKQLQQNLAPSCYLLTSKKEISELPILKEKYFSEESTIFVCTQQECLAPLRSVEGVLQIISAY